ncbi:hypothetical protein EYC95_04510 [Pseudomonas sp. BGI-2]|nr:hypothetical protein EYC95_04510 [Pseudomonas sp. BGI-2]
MSVIIRNADTSPWRHAPPVGAGLLTKRALHSIERVTDPPLSRASRIAAPPLPQGICKAGISRHWSP